jgi:nucleotide-binding universal stress UspA family protein
MFKRILVPVDGSGTSDRAAAAALDLARRLDGAVRFVHLLDETAFAWGYGFGPDLMESARAGARKILLAAEARAREAQVPADWQLIEAHGQRLGDAIAEHARQWNADLVVVGTHGRRGVARAMLGSGAEQVIRLAPVPVLVIRGPDAAEA